MSFFPRSIRRHSLWVFGFFLYLFAVAVLHAEVNGRISGVVRDTSGAAMVGAHVTATNLQTGRKQSVVCDRDGSYGLLALPPGTY